MLEVKPVSLALRRRNVDFADAYADALGLSRSQSSRLLFDFLEAQPPTLLDLMPFLQRAAVRG